MRKLLSVLLTLFVASTLSAATSTDSDVTGVSAGGGGSISWTACTVTVNNGGTLTYDTDYCRYAVSGSLLYWQFSITQTAAGSGTTDVTIDAPGSVTLSDNTNAGSVSTFDMGNNNIWSPSMAVAVNSTNDVYFRREGLGTNIRGGTFIGNNGQVNISANIVTSVE